MGLTALQRVKESLAVQRGPDASELCLLPIFLVPLHARFPNPRPMPRPKMRNPFRLFPHAWVPIPLCACGFLIWADLLRIQRVEYVSGIAEASGTEPAGAPTPAGRTGWRPRLIVPGHDNTSYEWLDQTQQMFARREWRVRHIDYENAPFGHEVDLPHPTVGGWD
jgi:hypothetical protein